VLPKNARLEDMLAFDTGPGNMLIDAAMSHFFGKPYDAEGAIGKTGQVNQEVLTELLKHPYFAKSYPKTTGREDFGVQVFDEWLLKYQGYHLSPADWVATLTALTAKSLANDLLKFNHSPLSAADGRLSSEATVETNHHQMVPATEVIIGGGGSYNPTLLQMIREQAPGMKIITQEELGYSSDAKEAVAMAILGKFTLAGIPNNVPSATGAKHPVVLGRISGQF